jgi:hypothetical protein|nr:MAG TPA: stabilization protein [Caudoviricetes sp.]
MPIERSEQLTTISFSDFTGGMNTAQPGSQIAENEAQLIENYEYDYNRLRTRGGLSAPLITLEGDEIESFFYDQMTNGYLIFGKTPEVEKQTAKIYFADITSGVKDVGTLTGRSRPVCCKFGGDIFIASGGKLQVYDFETLKIIDGSYLCDNVFERYGKLVTTMAGDDNLRYSSVGDAKSEEAWVEKVKDDSSAKWLEVGYKDDGDIITCLPMANDIIVFKDNGMIYSVSGEYPAWNVSLLGQKSDAERVRQSIVTVGSSIAFITKAGIRSLDAVQVYGNFQINEIGYKINKAIAADVHTPLCWNLIRKRQLVISPNIESRNKLFVYQYNMTAGYVLTFPEPILDMADTTDGVVLAIGNRLHRWSFEFDTDNGLPIETKVMTRQVLTGNNIITRRFDVFVESNKEGNLEIDLLGKTVKYSVQDKRRIKHFYSQSRGFELCIRCDTPHILNYLRLYAMEV